MILLKTQNSHSTVILLHCSIVSLLWMLETVEQCNNEAMKQFLFKF